MLVLSQTLTQLRASSTREAANWKASKSHQDDIEELQAANFELAGKITENEKKLQAAKNEMEELSRALDHLDQVDMESQEEMDKDAIAVGLFRQMGFVPCYQKYDTLEESNVFESIMVRSETRNRSTELEVNDEMMKARAITPYILANHLWLASE
jgi:seryl-tRNA synthetase